MPLLIFATLAEAHATLEALCAHPLTEPSVHVWSEGLVPALYASEQHRIAISGLGVMAAQHAAVSYGKEHDEIWNLGIAGALSDELAVGDLLSIQQVGKHLPLPPRLDPLSRDIIETTTPLFAVASQGGRLLSTDIPLHDAELRDRLSARWDLIDMEGYGVAYAAHHLGKKCRLWKVVSDFASPSGRQLIAQNKKRLSALLAEKVLERNSAPL